MDIYDYSKNELIDLIKENNITAFEVTQLNGELLSDNKVLLTFLCENTIPLEFVLQNPILRKKYEMVNGIHQAVLMSNTRLGQLWSSLESTSDRDYNIILEALCNKGGTIRNDQDFDRIWVVYSIYPGMKEIMSKCPDRIPTIDDIKILSDEILNSKSGKTTVERKLLLATQKAEKIRKDYSDAISSLLEDYDDFEDVNPFVRKRNKKY